MFDRVGKEILKRCEKKPWPVRLCSNAATLQLSNSATQQLSNSAVAGQQAEMAEVADVGGRAQSRSRGL
jgi:hypothetical protein